MKKHDDQHVSAAGKCVRSALAFALAACVLPVHAYAQDVVAGGAGPEAAVEQQEDDTAEVQPGAGEGVRDNTDAGKPTKRATYTEKARMKGTWKYKTVKKHGKKQKVKASFRYKNGSYPARVTRIGKSVYYFKNSKGALGTSKKAQRVVELGGRRYCVTSAGTLKHGWEVVGNALCCFAGPYRSALTSVKKDGIQLSAGGKAVMTLDAAVKLQCIKTLDKVTNRNASKKTQLRAAWRYLTGKTFSYRALYFNPKDKAWAKKYAYEMLLVHKGNCYGFAACFAALATEIGYKAYVVSGRVPGSRDGAGDGYTRHAVVKINGRWYDPEAQFAGWARGIYNAKRYRVSFKPPKGHDKLEYKKFTSFSGTGDPRGLSKSVKAMKSYRVVKKGDRYYGYRNSKKLTGLYAIKGKLYRFNKKHYTTVAARKKLNAAAKKNSSWKQLRKLAGAYRKTVRASSCYGAGTDRVYQYAHVEVSTFKPAKGGAEVVTGFAAR